MSVVNPCPPTPTKPEPRVELLNASQAATWSGFSIRTIKEWTKQKKIPHIRLGDRGVRYPLTALERWIEQQTIEPTGTTSQDGLERIQE